MVETAIYAQWMHRDWFTPWYARWTNGEVDMVGLNNANLKPDWATEIKWSNRFFKNPKALKSLHKFCAQNGLNNAMVTTIDQAGTVEYNNLQLHFVPASLYAYSVGKNIL